MFINEELYIQRRVAEYFYSYESKKSHGDVVFIDMAKINNYHILNERYAIFHGYSEYKNSMGKILFNVYVTPIHNELLMLSILVKVNKENISDIMSSLSTKDPKNQYQK